MKIYTTVFFAAVLATLFCGCLGPVMQVGDKFVPVKTYQGVPVVNARNSIYKEIRYSTFAFDWDENDGFLIPVRKNSLNNAFWSSKLTQAEKLYSVVFTAGKMRHCLKQPDTNILQKYLENSYREIPVPRSGKPH